MLSRVVAAVVAVIAMFVVYALYVGGSPFLAVAFGGGFGLAFFVYTARGAYSARYLFPGLASIALFIVLPLVYTVWIGFTNYSSKNLLTFERATDVLLGEQVELGSSRYPFTLHADGSGFRIVLKTGEDEPASDAPADTGSMFDDKPAPGGDSAGSDGAGSGGPGSGSAGSGSAGSGSAGSGSAGSGSADSSDRAGGSSGTDRSGSGSASRELSPTTGSARGGGGTGDASDTPAPAAGTAPGAGSAAPSPPAHPRPTTVFVTPALPLTATSEQRAPVKPLAESGFTPGDPLPLKDVIAHRDAIRALIVQFPDGSSATMESLREFTPRAPLYRRNADGSLTDQKTGVRLTPNTRTGYYETPAGERVLPGFRTYVGIDNYTRAFTDEKFRGPFFRVFLWTIVFAGLTVLFCTSLGLLLAELLSWEGLRFAGVYRVLLFLPYAVPAFISILVFKGLFNRNFGEINMILDALLGIRPNWIGNALLARIMILIVNTWLGYPYFMLIGTGLQKAIPRDLYEASALAGAGPWTNFTRITWPLIRKPLMPLIVSAFAYNFNNFVLIFLLTAGRPDFLDTSVPAGETDILVSYTYRIAFEDSGQNFGLAAAIATLIFVMVAILSVINLRLTKANAEERR